jgi:predicted kinase
MRKWMRERLQRRKQKSQAEKPASEPTQEPLQPTYYESQQPERVADSGAEEHREPEETMPAESPSEPQAESSSQSGERSRRRRRRGRGGRGRGSAKPAAPLQPTLMREAEPAVQRTEPEPVAAAPTQAAPATPAKPKGVVVLAIGLPGSGKSSWFKRHNIRPLSSDLLRELLFDNPTEQRFQDLVFSNLRSMLKARLIARRPMNYVDATNLSPHERHTWIKMAHDYGYEVQAVFFDVPLEVCLERNQRRQRVVGEDVMHRMSAKLRAPKFEEGFSKITVVRVKKKE